MLVLALIVLLLAIAVKLCLHDFGSYWGLSLLFIDSLICATDWFHYDLSLLLPVWLVNFMLLDLFWLLIMGQIGGRVTGSIFDGISATLGILKDIGYVDGLDHCSSRVQNTLLD